MLTGERHAARAIEAARALLRATGHAGDAAPWAPVGAGIHTGPMWLGTIGSAGRVELTVVGDSVNTTARLASAASAGEILVSTAAAENAGLDPHLLREALSLKGKSDATGVFRLQVSR